MKRFFWLDLSETLHFSHQDYSIVQLFYAGFADQHPEVEYSHNNKLHNSSFSFVPACHRLRLRRGGRVLVTYPAPFRVGTGVAE